MISPEENTPDYLAIATAVTQVSDWKEALDSVMSVVRSVFIFDNLALYLAEEDSRNLTEIVYARAVGRGQSAGAEATWGLEVANQAISGQELVLQEPSSETDKSNRLASPYLLGMPLRTADQVIGAVVFVRFGGPTYTPPQIRRAQYIATQFSSLLERKILREQIRSLQEARMVIALQEDFIATISHELRTPLGFIKGYTTTLLRQDTEWDEATRREFLSIIEEEADHLSMLIENVLESARLQSNTLPMSFQDIRLDSIIRDMAVRAQARYKDTEIYLALKVTPIVKADGVRLAQVLSNFFSNAAKYAPGSPITISLVDYDDYYRICFSDKGPGISPEHAANLFQRFYRVPGQTGTGSGLGLFICKKIVEAHGGSISIESKSGEGTTFIIDLPADMKKNSKEPEHVQQNFGR